MEEILFKTWPDKLFKVMVMGDKMCLKGKWWIQDLEALQRTLQWGRQRGKSADKALRGTNPQDLNF